MKYPCDGECQVSGAHAALFDWSRREASRPCAAGCEPLAHDHKNCPADFSRRRALTLGSAAQPLVPALGTHFGTPNYEIPAWRRVPRLLVRALLCSTRHTARRRGPVRRSVNPWRTTQRIAAQILVVGARSRSVLLRKLWSPFWEHVSVPKIMKYPCDGECHAALCAHCFARLVTPRCVAALCGQA